MTREERMTNLEKMVRKSEEERQERFLLRAMTFDLAYKEVSEALLSVNDRLNNNFTQEA